MSSNAPHILVFPYPAQGHMLPLLDLTHNLALRGATITIIITPKNLPILNPLLSRHPSSIHTLVFPFPTHPSIPPGVENVKDAGNHSNPAFITALHSLSHPISLWFQSHPSPPQALLSDFFLGWTVHLASDLGVPRIAFYSSGAFLASLLHNLLPDLRRIQALGNDSLLPLPHFPSSPSFPRRHLPSLLLLCCSDKPDPVQTFVKDSMIANASSWGFVFNSFHAVEAEYLDHVRSQVGHALVWAVGPLSLLGSDSGERGGSGITSGSEVFEWLDGCPDGSVVYVCFGSQVALTGRQVEALTAGLEQSGTRFILVVRKGDDDVVPHGFEDRVDGKGVVIRGWAPQVAMLSHRAVGGFVTHCGWNSVLEGVAAGVVLLAWPMEADQFVNAKLLVEYMGVAVRVCEGKDAVPNSDELGRCVAESMGGSSLERVRAKELAEKTIAAVKEGGSSARDLDALVEELQLRKRSEKKWLMSE